MQNAYRDEHYIFWSTSCLCSKNYELLSAFQLHYKNPTKFSNKIVKLVKFTQGKQKNPKFSQIFVKELTKSLPNKPKQNIVTHVWFTSLQYLPPLNHITSGTGRIKSVSNRWPSKLLMSLAYLSISNSKALERTELCIDLEASSSCIYGSNSLLWVLSCWKLWKKLAKSKCQESKENCTWGCFHRQVINQTKRSQSSSPF